MKQLIQNTLARFGYTLRRISKLKPFVPFVRDFPYPEASIRMWIANADDVDWYDETVWNKRGEYRALRQLAKNGDRVLEIGSHQSQLALNRSLSNVQFVNAAGSDTPGVARIIPSHNSCVTGQTDGDTIEVPAITGDSLDEKYGPFDMIKVDVEGFELEVLKGCSKILSRTPKLALELHFDELRRRGHSTDEIFRLIDISRYEGLVVPRPDDGTIQKFDLSTLPKDYAANVFLEKKSK